MRLSHAATHDSGQNKQVRATFRWNWKKTYKNQW